ncbi:MAG: calcineurin-like phosphoesterase C-terminal domain-containing protein [Bacteroidota bacterium]|nr:calcineurin-like phosphoesterase C-terminal domain-containing protein [Bacteroidota bacterium]
MGKNKKRNIQSLFTCLLFLFAAVCFSGALYSCKNSTGNSDVVPLKISEVSIPSTINVQVAGNITLSGKGFETGDEFLLTLVSDETKVDTCTVNSVTDHSATFSIPVGFTSGLYKITVRRDQSAISLGSTTINVVPATSVPDEAGMTLKGIVYSNGTGIPGVVVSDGYEVTTTDNNGIYYLASQKKSGFVFISVPGNYEVSTANSLPQFYKRLAGGSSVERNDFSLMPVDNSKHVMLVMTDMHLANRNDDVSQISNGFIPDISSTIVECMTTGEKVYGLNLGDMTWDLYWYDGNFSFTDYLNLISKINIPVFDVMGNHDNDPYYASDWGAEQKFKNSVGPSYYSFNLGKVHYVVLDDIVYINNGGSQGVIGDRTYNDAFTSAQIQWLNKDLSTIADKSTPIVIAIHAPLFSNPTIDTQGNQTSNYAIDDASDLVSAVQGFSNVHVLSGHTHVNYNVKVSSSLFEHNIAAVCATWWWTGKSGYAGNQICKDGSVAGYNVLEMNGKDVKWYYKSIGYPKNYQFRTYDLNNVYITAAGYAPNSTDQALAPYADVYSIKNTNNEVLINVWGYDPDWKVEVSENGMPLTVERVYAKDPLHIISYEAKRLNAGAEPTSSFNTGKTAHMFKVKASSANSSLDIKVTDRFGNVYPETMTRPKSFTYLMR